MIVRAGSAGVCTAAAASVVVLKEYTAQSRRAATEGAHVGSDVCAS